ncbi:MAG: hypothetical protein U5K30_01445 [Acidimicrobiales bacterium]|nr:hypothetical protein [Acidimicrobiales bacterium]
MRQTIRDEVEQDFAMDAELEQNPTQGYKLEAKITAARKWAERIAKQGFSRTEFYDLLHRQSDWVDHVEVTDAAFLAFTANEYGRVI